MCAAHPSAKFYEKGEDTLANEYELDTSVLNNL